MDTDEETEDGFMYHFISWLCQDQSVVKKTAVPLCLFIEQYLRGDMELLNMQQETFLTFMGLLGNPEEPNMPGNGYFRYNI